MFNSEYGCQFVVMVEVTMAMMAAVGVAMAEGVAFLKSIYPILLDLFAAFPLNRLDRQNPPRVVVVTVGIAMMVGTKRNVWVRVMKAIFC